MTRHDGSDWQRLGTAPLSRRNAQRLRKRMKQALTPLQYETLWSCAAQGKRCAQLARERGVHRSTVWRTMQQAKIKLRRALEEDR